MPYFHHSCGQPMDWHLNLATKHFGVFAVGETEKALKYLQYYSTRRLLGEQVQAYPEKVINGIYLPKVLCTAAFIPKVFSAFALGPIRL